LDDEAEKLLDTVQEPVARAVPPSREGVQLGDQVKLDSLNVEGIVMELSQEQVEVQVGRLRVRARLDEISRLEHEVEREPEGRIEGSITLRAADPLPLEFEIRGMIVEDALNLLDKRLDAAFLAGMPFLRVIHGKGTGRLRDAVRQFLSSNEYVASFQPGSPAEGGEGVTVVHLAV
jgi:DNA mismatch repair protein MutS2